MSRKFIAPKVWPGGNSFHLITPPKNDPIPPEIPVITDIGIISGTHNIGDTLTHTGYTFTSSGSITRQWYSDGVVISGAIGPSYIITSGDENTDITVEMTVTNITGSDTDTTPAITVNIVAPIITNGGTISGIPEVGNTLSVTGLTYTGNFETVSYQWVRGGSDIIGATSSAYTLVSADDGNLVARTTTVTNASGSDSLSSNFVSITYTAPVLTSPGTLASATEGEEVTITGLTYTGSAVTISYQWLFNGSNISGATSSTYTPIEGDIGGNLSCAVTVTNDGGFDSDVTNSVVVSAGDPVITNVGTLSGAVVGSISTVSGEEYTGDDITISYEWIADGSIIIGANDSTYIPNENDYGMFLSRRVTIENSYGVASATTNQVEVIGVSPSYIMPPFLSTQDGILEVGSTITLFNGVASGFPVPEQTLQLKRDAVDIPGEIGDPYIVTSADMGANLTLVGTLTNVSGTDTASSTALLIPEEPALFSEPRLNIAIPDSAFNTVLTSIGSLTPTEEVSYSFGRYSHPYLIKSDGATWHRARASVVSINDSIVRRVSIIYRQPTSLASSSVYVGVRSPSSVRTSLAGTQGGVLTGSAFLTFISDVQIGDLHRVTFDFTPNETGDWTIEIGPNTSVVGDGIVYFGSWAVMSPASISLTVSDNIPDRFTPADWVQEWDTGGVSVAGARYGQFESLIVGGTLTYHRVSAIRDTPTAIECLYIPGIGGKFKATVKINEVGGNESVVAGTVGSLGVTSSAAGVISNISDVIVSGDIRRLKFDFSPITAGQYRVGFGANDTDAANTVTILGGGATGGNIASQAPVNVNAPSVVGTPVVGQTVLIDVGEWVGYPTPSFAVQMQRDGADISGATDSSEYTIVSADLGAALRAKVTVTNSEGTVIEYSEPIGPVTTPATIPTGSVLYVGADGVGSDSNSGASSGAPLATIAKALSLWTPGTEIWLGAGTHTLPSATLTLPINASATINSPIVIKGDPAANDPANNIWGTTVVSGSAPASGKFSINITGSYYELHNFELSGISSKSNNDGGPIGIFGSSNTLRSDGSVITSGTGEIGVAWQYQATGIKLIGLKITGTGIDAIKTARAKDLHIAGCYIDFDGSESMFDNVSGENITIEYNTVIQHTPMNDCFGAKTGSINLFARYNDFYFDTKQTFGNAALGGVGASAESRPALPEGYRDASLLGGHIHHNLLRGNVTQDIMIQGGRNLLIEDNLLFCSGAKTTQAIKSASSPSSDSSGSLNWTSGNNTIQNNKYSSDYKSNFHSATDVNLEGNVVTGNTGYSGTISSLVATHMTWGVGHTNWS